MEGEGEGGRKGEREGGREGKSEKNYKRPSKGTRIRQ